jgi:hypothetical protein
VGDTPDPPRARGAWDRLHALIHRSRRESARREAELVAALTRWREAARALPDGVVILDDDRISWCNDTAQLHPRDRSCEGRGHADHAPRCGFPSSSTTSSAATTRSRSR